MAEEKKDAAPAPFKKTVYNKGTRYYHLATFDTGKKDKDGKPVLQPRVLGPGASIEVTDEGEYNHILQYRDVVDMDKFVPGGNDRVAALEKEREELKARIAELEDLTSDKGPEGGKKKGK